MRISSSEVAFQAAHQRTDRREERVELQVWRAPASGPRPDTLSLSERGLQAASLPSPGAAPESDGLAPALSLVKQVLEDLLGLHIEVYQPQAPASDAASVAVEAPPPPRRAPTSGAGFELTALSTRTETEHLSVSAQGIVRTADGRELRIELGIELQRSFVETTTLTVSGGSEAPRRKDPLVINLSGRSAEIDGARIEFDLDADGVAEKIPNVTAASGFLALDRNANGHIDNGSELFGARSGSGFSELAQLDDDGNGWIDEADRAYAALQVWRRDAQGQDRTQSLAEAGVGAINVGSAIGRFEYRDAEQKPLAELRATGLYLSESGQAGSVQQLDFFV